MKCHHKGCEEQHQSTTGFCHIHAADIDKQVIQEQRYVRKVAKPKLAEEVKDD